MKSTNTKTSEELKEKNSLHSQDICIEADINTSLYSSEYTTTVEVDDTHGSPQQMDYLTHKQYEKDNYA
jgi:hypothetical protein